jgi:putative acetyltransferase
MRIRAYREADALPTLDTFLRAIRETAGADYSTEQIGVWGRDRDETEWADNRRGANTLVAVDGDRIAGFIDLDESGYIDMLFVSPDFARRGVATALLGAVLDTAIRRAIPELTVHASLTARPFFERHDFTVVEERHPVVQGVELTNYRMRRALAASS